MSLIRAIYAERVDEFERTKPGYRYQFGELRAKLLSLGGTEVVVGLAPITDLTGFLDHGELDGRSPRLETGRVSACYYNVASLWAKGILDNIVTGYGLSDDGLWREHCWGVHEGYLVETTLERKMYFGRVLSQSEARELCDEEGVENTLVGSTTTKPRPDYFKVQKFSLVGDSSISVVLGR